jgi:ribosomal protein RSM22 (predicted rRNA methylase)
LEALYTKVKNDGFLVLVEYGSPFGARLIHEARKWAIQKKMYIAAPCPHQLKCPLAKSKSWCHFDQPSGIYPKNVFGKLPTDQAVRY